MNTTREASKAGSWYPSNPTELRKLLTSFSELAANQTNAEDILRQPCIAGIAPHAGLAFSGLCAARTYYALSQKNKSPKTVIITGAAHTYCSADAGIWAKGEWKTPLGSIKVDEELANEVLKMEYAAADYAAHTQDNAIELQTPFIKFFFPDSMILPIAAPPSNYSVKLGEDLARITADSARDYLHIGSTDFTHYGSAYGFAPAGDGIEGIEWARENDQRLISLIEDLETEKIIPEASSRHSACGSGAVTAVTAFASARGISSALTLEHVLSYDIMPSDPPELSVGYASIIF